MDAHRLPDGQIQPAKVRVLEELARKVLWLACWMIHHANHIRPNRDGVKVGGNDFALLVALNRIPRAQKTPMMSISPLVQLVWASQSR